MITYKGMKLERLKKPRQPRELADGWYYAPISCFLLENYRGPFHDLQAAQDAIDGRMKTPGQMAYEADCEIEPTYDDGTKRRAWNKLPDFAKASWERLPTVRAMRAVQAKANQ